MISETTTATTANTKVRVTHQHSGDFCAACYLEKLRQRAAMLAWIQERKAQTELGRLESQSTTVEVRLVRSARTTGLPDTRPGDPMVNAVAESADRGADA